MVSVKKDGRLKGVIKEAGKVLDISGVGGSNSSTVTSLFFSLLLFLTGFVFKRLTSLV